MSEEPQLSEAQIPVLVEQIDRFLLDHNTKGCINSKATKDPEGYGRLLVNYKMVGAHRLVYRIFNGRVPKSKIVMHTCDNPWCVNPSHLRLGTKLDNHRDMVNKGRAYFQNKARPRNLLKFCKRGHELKGSNVKTFMHNGVQKRRCRTCGNHTNRKSYARTKQRKANQVKKRPN